MLSRGQAGEFAGSDEDAGEHRGVETAGVGIAKRGVIGGEEMEAVGEDVLGSVGEEVGGAAFDDPGVEEVGEVSVPCDPAQADDGAELREESDLGGEMSGTVANLLRERLVGGRGAADDGGDPGVAETKAVGGGDGSGSGGEAEAVEDGIHEIAGAVSGEGAAGAVGAVGSGSEAEDEDAGGEVAESRNRKRPVGLVDVGTPARQADGFSIEAETRAALAGDDVLSDGLRGDTGGRRECGEPGHSDDDKGRDAMAGQEKVLTSKPGRASYRHKR